jgi:RNA polymerase sigma-70 factor (ECF subfamily)
MIPLELPDELLVIEAILGNLEAFEQLVVRYRPAVVRLARTIVGSEYAEALPSIEEPRKFAPWLSAITRHRALRFSKNETAHANKRVPLDEALLERIEALAIPFSYKALTDQALADKERDDAMLKAVDSLAEDYAMPLRLHFLDDMPLKRISAFMGVPLSTVKWRIHHGKNLLRAKLEK